MKYRFFLLAFVVLMPLCSSAQRKPGPVGSGHGPCFDQSGSPAFGCSEGSTNPNGVNGSVCDNHYCYCSCKDGDDTNYGLNLVGNEAGYTVEIVYDLLCYCSLPVPNPQVEVISGSGWSEFVPDGNISNVKIRLVYPSSGSLLQPPPCVVSTEDGQTGVEFTVGPCTH